jgi:undecaprenyl-diphosphatase
MLTETLVQLDSTVVAAMQNWPGWLYWPMWAASTIGHPVTLAVTAGTLGVYAWYRGRKAITYSVGAAIIAIGLNTLLKDLVQRPRPATDYVSNMYFQTASFPSGHAFSALVVLGLFAYLATQYLPKPWRLIVASSLWGGVVLIGISRVYLGAHFITDVIAGWALGAIFLVLIIFICKPQLKKQTRH